MNWEFGVAQRPAHGEIVCGDAYRILSGERKIAIVADGLGHGPEAAKASLGFCAYVESRQEHGLEELFRGASKALSQTRGTAAALLRLDPSTGQMEYSSVGNVDIQVRSQSAIRPYSAPGIVGRPLRRVVCLSYLLVPGDLLTLYSDGISGRFSLEAYAKLTVQEMADQILEDHGKDHDDATCLVVRC